ncbi:hypothetical protein AJ78_08084 [Emergomyces pasteurianus Ep9510]|uniref:MINDY deubiquitinase domain-containing protein n=1 Tax=Emergomyces pasteurianus Ep9510 TaxID=1447872 RepID=A0A1J9P3X9_9EURO|nr:hypothetical protein AJ78_08084 [Emergomyces pasteurianus Ep9510]
MTLRNDSSDDPKGQYTWDNQNDSFHSAAISVLSAQNLTLSQLPASHLEVPRSTPHADVEQGDAPNLWMRDLAYRRAAREIPLLQQPDEEEIQGSQQHGRCKEKAQKHDSSDELPEKKNDGTITFPSKAQPSMGFSVEEGRHSGIPGNRHSNNPFLKVKPNSGGISKHSIAGLDPFNFPQSTSLDVHQNEKIFSHEHHSHGLDGELSQISSQTPFQHNSNNLSTQSDHREAENVNQLLDKGKELVVRRSSTGAIHLSDPCRQPVEMDLLSKNLNPEHKRLSSQLGSFSQSTSPNISLREQAKPNEIVETDIRPYPGKAGRSIFDDHPTLNNSVLKPDELDSSVSNSTAPAVAPDHFQPSLAQLNGYCQPFPVLQGKLSETYDIRQVTWTDGKTSLRKSPVLVQSENGPCPLLALVNGLVLRNKAGLPAPIAKALQSREKISLGLLMQALFDELTSYTDETDQLPDIEALSSFLVMLHTGMNVNPQLVLTNNTSNCPGTFLETSNTILYSSFKIPLVHGWLAEQSSSAYTALTRVAQNHEDIQLLHFQKEELEARAFRGDFLTPDDEKLIEYIHTIQQFVDVENATQLSAFGLEHLERCLEPGSISILFRNDHFSTLFKHPASNKLFTLVTDAGYADHAEIVWESLVDVNGSNAGFFSGDFQPVGNSEPPASHHPCERGPGSSSASIHRNNPNRSIGKTMSNTEQTDADYAFALSLQFQDEEEQRSPNPRNQAQIEPSHLPSNPRLSSQSQGVTHTLSNSGSNSRHRQSTSSTDRHTPRRIQEVRPLIPPPRSPVIDPSADAPPPTYEQAASSQVYTPSPDHSQYDGSYGRNPSIVGPRSSSYGFNYNLEPNRGPYNNGNRRMQASPNPSLHSCHRDRAGNKDCKVM